jgi:hypothetical protein
MKYERKNKSALNNEFDGILIEYNENIKNIANELRELLYSIFPDITEVIWGHQKTAGYGIGIKKMKEHFCHICPYKSHVNLGFNYGSQLIDKANILEGTGRMFRHIKLKTSDEVKNIDLKILIHNAIEDINIRNKK